MGGMKGFGCGRRALSAPAAALPVRCRARSSRAPAGPSARPTRLRRRASLRAARDAQRTTVARAGEGLIDASPNLYSVAEACGSNGHGLTKDGRSSLVLREQIEAWLEQRLGGWSCDADGDYHVTCDSARVFICPRTWVDDRSIVRIFSITNVDVPPSAALTRWLATESFHLTFGHFAYDERERTVWLLHNLLGDYLDEDELVTAVGMVATTANDHDDRIKARFGGRLFTEDG